MEITSIDLKVCDELRKEMQEFLNAFAEKRGIEIKVLKAKYSDEDINFQVRAALPGAEDKKMRQARLEAEFAGFKLESKGSKIVGYNGRLRSRGVPMPWMVKAPDGQTFKMADRRMIELGFSK